VLDFCWSIVWLVSGQVGFGILYKLSFNPSLLDSGSVWFGFDWFGLVVFATFLCPSCVDFFFWLGVQGGHSFEPIYWLFALETCLHCCLPSPGHWSLAVLVYPDSCEGTCFVITFVIEGVGYQAAKGVHAGMQSSTLSTKVHTTKKTSFYISASCGFGLTDQSEI